MAKTGTSSVALIFATFALIASADAQPGSSQKLFANPALQPASSAAEATPRGERRKIRFGQLTAIPNGYYEMCARHEGLCRIRGGRLAASRDGSIKLTDAAMSQLASVNADVNAAIRPAHREEWAPEQTIGDCKDFALTKQERLIAAGWPSSALPVAIVRTLSGERHLILVARTNEGDFVLDNLTERILPWASAAYSWEKIQSTTNVWAWRAVNS